MPRKGQFVTTKTLRNRNRAKYLRRKVAAQQKRERAIANAIQELESVGLTAEKAVQPREIKKELNIDETFKDISTSPINLETLLEAFDPVKALLIFNCHQQSRTPSPATSAADYEVESFMNKTIKRDLK